MTRKASTEHEQPEVATSAVPTPSEEQPATDAATDAVTATNVESAPDTAAPTAPETAIGLVICAYSGTEGIIGAVWKKHCNIPFKLVTVDESADIREIVEQCIADNEVLDDFVLIPANVIPCSNISFAELAMPVVYIDSQQEKHYNYRLPTMYSKQTLVDYLATTDAAGESFVRGYVEQFCNRPLMVGYSFGNYITPVLRPNPCTHVVAEAFVRRKFIVASPEGFAAIKDMIQDTLLK